MAWKKQGELVKEIYVYPYNLMTWCRGSKHSVWMGKSVATWKEFFQQKKCNKLSTIFEQFNENRNTN